MAPLITQEDLWFFQRDTKQGPIPHYSSAEG